MKKDYRCQHCINENCIIKVLGKLGNKIAIAYSLSLDNPEWRDITEYLPGVIDCSDFFPSMENCSFDDFDRLFEDEEEA